MLCINSTTTNPYFNIAAEEHLLKHFVDDIFYLYRNEPSVIVGKHQNTLAEIDIGFAKELGIKVVRRLSGGGAVYHDLGNLNFVFIKNGEVGKLVDFKGFTQPIVNSLADLGIVAKFEGHNSLTVNGKKISGNAEHIFKNRVLHHGTLLFSSNLDQLAQVLYVDEKRYTDKAIKSVRANVTNINEMLSEKMSIDDFSLFLWNKIVKSNCKSMEYIFTSNDINCINHLCESKYLQWDWNFGYSPKYVLKREINLGERALIFIIQVDRGRISDIEIQGSYISYELKINIQTVLLGTLHEVNKIKERLLQCNLNTNQINAISNGII
jgi:lipoate-protein ligase A